MAKKQIGNSETDCPSESTPNNGAPQTKPNISNLNIPDKWKAIGWVADKFGIPGLVIAGFFVLFFVFMNPLVESMSKGPVGLVEEMKATRIEITALNTKMTTLLNELTGKFDNHESRLVTIERAAERSIAKGKK